MHLVEILGFILPLAVTVLAVVIGARQVRFFRSVTHDDSVVTRVLSGDLSRVDDQHKHKEAA